MHTSKKSLPERVMNYDKTYPLGSVDQSWPVDVSELFNHLQMPGGVLLDLIKDEEIDRPRRSFDMPVAEHVPGQECVAKISATMIPNDECRRCRAVRAKWLSKLDPFGCPMETRLQSTNGSKRGLTTCLFWADSVLRYDVSLMMQSPEKSPGRR